MLRFLSFFVIVAVATAWDPQLKIAEKLSIPHHIRHSYEYPYINIAQIRGQINQNLRQGFSQLEGNRPQRQVFRQPAPVEPSRGFQSQSFDSGFQSRPLSSGFQSRPLGSGFQSQPFEQRNGFRNSPSRQSRFFELGSSRSSSPFSRRQS